MKRIWLLSIVLLAVAAVEFGALGAASAGASFVPGWLAASKDTQSLRRGDKKPTSTPVSPPACQPDREHSGEHACDGEPASIQLTPDPLVINCDGFDRSTLTVRITDAKGHPVADGTYVTFWAYNGNTMPSTAQTQHGVASTSVAFYGDIFPSGPNVNVDAGPLQAGVRIRCFPESNKPPSPPCAVGSPPASPPCATPTRPPCSVSPPSLSPPCATPSATPTCPPIKCGTPTPPPCPPTASPPCATPTPLTGSATIAVSAPSSPQAGGVPFLVPIELTSFTPGTFTTWAGYEFELAYDSTVLQPTSSAPGLCSADSWANPELAPHVISGCAFQNSTATGTLDTVTFTCLKEGSSQLRLVAQGDADSVAVGTSLFDENGVPFAMTLVNGSVTCASATTGGATIVVVALPPAHSAGVPFTVNIDLTQFTPVTSTTWAGYDLELAYDTTVLQATSDARGLCADGYWVNSTLEPHVSSGCFAQTSAATGTLDTITFVCLKEGVSALHLARPGAPDALMAGTNLFDVNANPFVLTLRDDEVYCGPPLTPTPTPATPFPLTPTPTPTCLSHCVKSTASPKATPTPNGSTR